MESTSERENQVSPHDSGYEWYRQYQVSLFPDNAAAGQIDHIFFFLAPGIAQLTPEWRVI
jgi:hypothetical protein